MKHIFPRVCEIIMSNLYVEDCMLGESSKEEVQKTTELKVGLEKSRFILKGFTISKSNLSEHLSDDGESVTIHIVKWAHQWKISFNPDPTRKAIKMQFSRKRNHRPHPPLFFNSLPVVSATNHKLLDCKRIGIIRHLSSYFTLNTLDQLCKMFVRPHLDYYDIKYHIPTVTNPPSSSIGLNYSMTSIESSQHQASLAVSGAWKGPK